MGAKWFCAGTKAPEGKTELLVGRYYPDWKNKPGYFQIKFFGGKEKHENGRQDESKEDTLIAEMKEELLSDGGEVVSQELVHTIKKPGHDKCFYLVGIKGPLRDEEILEEEERRDGKKYTEKLGKPFYMDAKELWRKIFPGHRPALKAIILHLAALRPEWAYVAKDLHDEMEALAA